MTDFHLICRATTRALLIIGLGGFAAACSDKADVAPSTVADASAAEVSVKNSGPGETPAAVPSVETTTETPSVTAVAPTPPPRLSEITFSNTLVLRSLEDAAAQAPKDNAAVVAAVERIAQGIRNPVDASGGTPGYSEAQVEEWRAASNLMYDGGRNAALAKMGEIEDPTLRDLGILILEATYDDARKVLPALEAMADVAPRWPEANTALPRFTDALLAYGGYSALLAAPVYATNSAAWPGQDEGMAVLSLIGWAHYAAARPPLYTGVGVNRFAAKGGDPSIQAFDQSSLVMYLRDMAAHAWARLRKEEAAANPHAKIPPKGEFETSAEFQARVAASEAASAQWRSEMADTEELRFQQQFETLMNATPRWTITSLEYDADREVFNGVMRVFAAGDEFEVPVILPVALAVAPDVKKVVANAHDYAITPVWEYGASGTLVLERVLVRGSKESLHFGAWAPTNWDTGIALDEASANVHLAAVAEKAKKVAEARALQLAETRRKESLMDEADRIYREANGYLLAAGTVACIDQRNLMVYMTTRRHRSVELPAGCHRFGAEVRVRLLHEGSFGAFRMANVGNEGGTTWVDRQDLK